MINSWHKRQKSGFVGGNGMRKSSEFISRPQKEVAGENRGGDRKEVRQEVVAAATSSSAALSVAVDSSFAALLFAATRPWLRSYLHIMADMTLATNSAALDSSRSGSCLMLMQPWLRPHPTQAALRKILSTVDIVSAKTLSTVDAASTVGLGKCWTEHISQVTS